MSKNTTKLEGIVEGAVAGSIGSLGLGILKGIGGNTLDFFKHIGQFVSKGYQGLEGIPTDWYITPEHFGMVVTGAALGGFLGGSRKKYEVEGSIEDLDLDKDLVGETVVCCGLGTMAVGLAAQYVLPGLAKLESLASYAPEIIKDYDPSIPDLLYVSIPTALVSGIITGYNKGVYDKFKVEQENKIEEVKK